MGAFQALFRLPLTPFRPPFSQESWAKPMSWAHFNAEGDVEFKAILYIPASAPPQFYDNYYTITPDVKLYVRRVFISDDFDDLLPRYLIFLKVKRCSGAKLLWYKGCVLYRC